MHGLGAEGFKCKKPYFGGEQVCAAAGSNDYDPTEVCDNSALKLPSINLFTLCQNSLELLSYPCFCDTGLQACTDCACSSRVTSSMGVCASTAGLRCVCRWSRGPDMPEARHGLSRVQVPLLLLRRCLLLFRNYALLRVPYCHDGLSLHANCGLVSWIPINRFRL